ncbi:XdhC family protein [Shewanella sp. UCD-KL21]|uniref:XdhC family protein n=1 Tax=Shewanella sp. UCD-KL21 TaxID=1917164 RepID=UPI000970ADED|nr:XdhC family protein [Shewanella sp. UCD-KL21]
MQLTDLNVLSGVRDWMARDESFWLCTIIGTYGSAPRPCGSLFAWNGKQRLGSISGGCLEDAFIKQLDNATTAQHYPYEFCYSKELVQDGIQVELPCGGVIRLLVEKINPEHADHIEQVYQRAASHQAFARQVDLVTAKAQVIEHQLPSTAVVMTENRVTIAYDQVWTILILGISQVSEWVAKLGLMAGCDVKVCDMRKSLADSWTFDAAAGGVDISWCSPDIFVDQHADKNSAVLALAHDPRIDDIGLMAAVESDAYYIGAMGSMKTTSKRFERLARIGELTDAQLASIHAPIGLKIGSKTPFEIAVSVIAGLIDKRHQLATTVNIKTVAA